MALNRGSSDTSMNLVVFPECLRALFKEDPLMCLFTLTFLFSTSAIILSLVSLRLLLLLGIAIFSAIAVFIRWCRRLNGIVDLLPDVVNDALTSEDWSIFDCIRHVVQVSNVSFYISRICLLLFWGPFTDEELEEVLQGCNPLVERFLTTKGLVNLLPPACQKIYDRNRGVAEKEAQSPARSMAASPCTCHLCSPVPGSPILPKSAIEWESVDESGKLNKGNLKEKHSFRDIPSVTEANTGVSPSPTGCVPTALPSPTMRKYEVAPEPLNGGKENVSPSRASPALLKTLEQMDAPWKRPLVSGADGKERSSENHVISKGHGRKRHAKCKKCDRRAKKDHVIRIGALQSERKEKTHIIPLVWKLASKRLFKAQSRFDKMIVFLKKKLLQLFTWMAVWSLVSKSKYIRATIMRIPSKLTVTAALLSVYFWASLSFCVPASLAKMFGYRKTPALASAQGEGDSREESNPNDARFDEAEASRI